MIRKRPYKSGSRWAFWRWTDTPSDYLTRLHIVQTPWFSVHLHFLNGPDPEPYLHDHPTTFVSIILRGGYFELRQRHGWKGQRAIWRGRFNRIKASVDDRHRIAMVSPGTVTLSFHGPKRREWGFHVPGDGWVSWKVHNDRKYPR